MRKNGWSIVPWEDSFLAAATARYVPLSAVQRSADWAVLNIKGIVYERFPELKLEQGGVVVRVHLKVHASALEAAEEGDEVDAGSRREQKVRKCCGR